MNVDDQQAYVDIVYYLYIYIFFNIYICYDDFFQKKKNIYIYIHTKQPRNMARFPSQNFIGSV